MKRSDTKKRILQTAIRLFSREGYDAVTMRQIAHEVGIRGGSIYNHFDNKETILSTILDYSQQILPQYQPQPEEVLELLKTQSPAEILTKHVTFYQDTDDTLRMALHRLLYMEMYNHKRVAQVVYQTFFHIPVESLKRTLDTLAEAEAIPQGDNRSLAELWNCTALVYDFEATHHYDRVDWIDYYAMTQFFIQAAVRGITVIPTGQVDLHWDVQTPFWGGEELESDTKKRILLAALDLFSKSGYSSVTIRQIADAVGIKGGSIYNHYASKSEIMLGITQEILNGCNQYKTSNPAFQAVIHPRDAIKIIVSLSSSYPPVKEELVHKAYRTLFRERYFNEELKDFFLSAIYKDRETIAQTLKELEAERRIQPCERKQIATAYVHTMCALTIGATMDLDHTGDFEHMRLRAVAWLISLILNGYQK